MTESISQSRIYMALVYDQTSPYECRFEKFTLPESYENNSGIAKNYYLLKINDIYTHILACISLEDFAINITNVITEENFYKSGIIMPTDMKEVCSVLDKYSKEPNKTYSMILKSILKELDKYKKRFEELRKYVSLLETES